MPVERTDLEGKLRQIEEIVEETKEQAQTTGTVIAVIVVIVVIVAFLIGRKRGKKAGGARLEVYRLK